MKYLTKTLILLSCFLFGSLSLAQYGKLKTGKDVISAYKMGQRVFTDWNLQGGDFRGAKYNEKTKFPSNLNPSCEMVFQSLY